MFYVSYLTTRGPYSGRQSGGILKLNHTYDVELDMLFGQDLDNTFINIDVDLLENVYGLFQNSAGNGDTVFFKVEFPTKSVKYSM